MLTLTFVGAYINVESDYKLQFNKFDAVPHPDIKPMVCSIPFLTYTAMKLTMAQAYANNGMNSMMGM